MYLLTILLVILFSNLIFLQLSYFYNLYYFKQNNLIKNKNYYVYFINTPDNLILSCVNDFIKLYYQIIGVNLGCRYKKSLF